MFVVDTSDAKIYAYDLDDGSYDPGKDINLASDNNGATGIWGNDDDHLGGERQQPQQLGREDLRL